MSVKDVSISAMMGSGTKIECKAGSHTFVIDQPKTGGGQDLGPTPLEYYVASVAGCIMSIARIVARQKNIDLRSMTIRAGGSLNTDVLLGKSSDSRAGFHELILEVSMDTDLSPDKRMEFLEEVERRCPVSENTANPTPIHLRMAA